MFGAISLTSYLAAAALFHCDRKRTALPEHSEGLLYGVRLVAWTLMAVTLIAAIGHWGAERGIANGLSAICLTSLLSVVFATRWPTWHLRSTLPALLLLMIWVIA